MKIEYVYTAPYQLREPFLQRRITVFYTGERVGPGRYVCTFCGKDTVVGRPRVLTPCHACDSSEYTLDTVAA